MTHSARSRRAVVTMAAGAAALGLAVAGCSAAARTERSAVPDHRSPSHPPSSASPAPPTETPVALTANVTRGATDVPVDTRVSISAADGRLTSVSFQDAAGNRLAGSFDASHTRWTAAQRLDPAVHYVLRAQGVNSDGTTTRTTTAFRTERLTLDQQTYPGVTPLTHGPFGIAMPVIVHFDIPVTRRTAFERHMAVTSKPAQAGSWSWVSDQEVHWRPRAYWKPGTVVDVDLHLNGLYAGKGIYGQEDRHVRFHIGRSVVIRADVSTDKMHVLVGGKLARVIPITGGKPGGFQTRSGVKVISEKHPSQRMNSATVGINPNSSNGYNIPNVRYAMRVTNSGEFLHAAPWSVYAQGRFNVSHGCIGMNMANASWLYHLTPVGTPVEVTGSTRRLEPGNGWTDWNESWAQFRAGSALH